MPALDSGTHAVSFQRVEAPMEWICRVEPGNDGSIEGRPSRLDDGITTDTVILRRPPQAALEGREDETVTGWPL
jgi:hypothetical protein